MTATEEAPATSRSGGGAPPPPRSGGSMLFAMMTRLRTVAARDLPHMPRAVLHVMADRANGDGLAWPKVETVAREAGMSESSARLALQILVLARWLVVVVPATPRDSARYEVRLDGLPVLGCRPPAPRRSRVPSATTQSAGLEHPGCREQAPRVPGATPEAPSEAPTYPPKESPNTAQGVPAGSARQLRVAGTEGAKPPPPPKAADRYASAFIEGQAAAGGVLAALSKAEKDTLGKAAAAHAVYRDGSKITGDGLVAWFRQRAEDFRRRPDAARVRGGCSPFGFLAWLNDGHDGKPAPWAPGTEPAPPPPPEVSRPIFAPGTTREQIERGRQLINQTLAGGR